MGILEYTVCLFVDQNSTRTNFVVQKDFAYILPLFSSQISNKKNGTNVISIQFT